MMETRDEMIKRVDLFWSSMQSEEVIRAERVQAARENREEFGRLLECNDPD